MYVYERQLFFIEGCFTTNSSISPQQGKPCVLKDWIYEKDTKVYKGCANPGSTSDAAWCPTKIENGVFLTNSDEWGYCNEDCTIIDGGIDGKKQKIHGNKVKLELCHLLLIFIFK